MSRQIFYRSAMAVAVLAAVTGVYIHTGGFAGGGMQSADAANPASVASAAPAPASSGAVAVATDFSSMVEGAGPAVVNISVTGSAKASASGDADGSIQGDPDDPSYALEDYGEELVRIFHSWHCFPRLTAFILHSRASYLNCGFPADACFVVCIADSQICWS